MNRRGAAKLLMAIGFLPGTLGLAGPAVAGSYPDKPIKLVVPYPPGASTDVTARLIGRKVSQVLGQSVIVENRSGATGDIGSENVARQEPDGYTFMLGTDATHASNYHLHTKPAFNPLKDFTPLALIATNPVVLVVNAEVPAHTVKEYVEGVRSGKIGDAYGSSGTGSPHHLAGELLRSMTQIPLIQVPYRGGGPALNDLMGGQVPAIFSSIITVMPYVQSGKLRVLAVTDKERYAGLPDVPTMAETYPGFYVPAWLGFFAPAKLPADVSQKLGAAIEAALQDPDIRQKIDSLGLVVPQDTSAAALADMQKKDFDLKGKIIEDAHIKVD